MKDIVNDWPAGTLVREEFDGSTYLLLPDNQYVRIGTDRGSPFKVFTQHMPFTRESYSLVPMDAGVWDYPTS